MPTITGRITNTQPPFHEVPRPHTLLKSFEDLKRPLENQRLLVIHMDFTAIEERILRQMSEEGK